MQLTANEDELQRLQTTPVNTTIHRKEEHSNCLRQEISSPSRKKQTFKNVFGI